MNIKESLKVIHHHCSEKYFQNYLDECHFRLQQEFIYRAIFQMLARINVN